LVTHRQPDPDGLGSLYALSNFIAESGCRVSVFFEGRLSGNLGVVSMVSAASANPNDFDLIIGVDYGSIDRLYLPWEWRDSVAERLISIDHHESATNKGVLTIVDHNACSTSLLIYRYFKYNKFFIKHDVATALYWGIFNDSGGFAHVNTGREVFDVASDLIRSGAANNKVANNFLYRERNVLNIWGEALKGLQFNAGLRLGYVCLDYNFFRSYNVRLKELSGLTNIILRAKEVKVALVISEFRQDFIDGSLRASMNWPVNAAKIAERFGGGGHRRAAGFQTRAGLAESLQKVKEALI